MGSATEGPSSANPGPQDAVEGDPADPTRICWTQWLRAQEADQACDRSPRVLRPPPDPDDEALLRRLLGDD